MSLFVDVIARQQRKMVISLYSSINRNALSVTRRNTNAQNALIETLYRLVIMTLKGKNWCDVVGIYAIMHDYNCVFLCRDFDSISYITITKSVPTLFDELGELDLINNEGLIFNGKTYFRPFAKKTSKSERSIVISSHKLYAVLHNNIVNMFKELSANGVEIMILTRKDNEQSAYFKAQSLSVCIIPSLSLCCTIIDKHKVWYGSINTLGYANEEDSVIKNSNSSLANELVNELFN